MTRAISLGAAPEADVGVELWGHLYTTRPITRSVQQLADDVQGKIEAANDTDTLMGLLADLIGVLLLPDDDTVPPAADLIREKWTDDAVSVSQLRKLAEDIREAGEAPS